MINVKPYIEKLELLRRWINIFIDEPECRIIKFNDGSLMYDPRPSFEDFCLYMEFTHRKINGGIVPGEGVTIFPNGTIEAESNPDIPDRPNESSECQHNNNANDH